METLKILHKLYKENKINKQQFKTYRGQVLNGDETGCLRGLKRKELIWGGDPNEKNDFKWTG